MSTMNSLINLSCGVDNNHCNAIKPIPMHQIFGVNPDTGLDITDRQRKEIMKTFDRICKTNSGNSPGTCCQKAIDTSNPVVEKQIEEIRAKYPSMRVNVKNTIITSVELSKEVEAEKGWEPISPYIMCKLSNADINPVSNTRFMATKLVKDCYSDNCGNLEEDITLNHIMNTANVKEVLEYSYYDDLKVIENIKEGIIDGVKSYIRKYNSVNNIMTHNDYRYRQIHIASIYGQTEIVDMLIALNADINVIDKFGNTPLHFACEKGYFAIVLSLLNQGVELSLKNGRGETPVFNAVRNGDIGMMRLLYNNSANLMDINRDGDNLIHHAIKYSSNKDEMVAFLIKYGVPLNKKNKDGKYPIDIAMEKLKQKKLNVLKTEDDISLIDKKMDIENISVKKVVNKNYGKSEKDLLALITLLEKYMFKQKYGDTHQNTGFVPYGYPVHLETDLCIGEGLQTDLPRDKCEKAGGRIASIVKPSTITEVSYYPESKSATDGLDESELYYPRNRDKIVHENTPIELLNFNETAKAGIYTNKNRNVDSENIIKQYVVEGFDNRISNINWLLIAIGFIILLCLVKMKL